MNKLEERDMRKYIELNKKDNFITELHEELIRERQITNEKIKEIERLNNIINELEKWLNKEIKRLDEMQDTYDKYGKKKDANIIYISGAYNEVLDKLQELKGEDK